MTRFEVLTPLRNGKKKPHPVGSIVELDESDARELVAIRALRPVAVADQGTGGQIAAPVVQDNEPDFIEGIRAARKELEALSHKKLDTILKAEGIADVASEGAKPTVKEKAAAIIDARAAKSLGLLSRDGLVLAAEKAGFADLAALGLADDAEEDAIRAALAERVSAVPAEA